MRLDKYLRQCSLGTAKKVREDVINGFVKVNGQTVLKPAVEINEVNDEILWKGEKTVFKENVYYMFNKPSGCITAKNDINSKTVFDYFKEEDKEGIFHVGRLDKDTEGLLIFTSDGKYNDELMNPDKHATKKYFFAALGTLDDEAVKLLESGVDIGSNEPLTKPAVVCGIVNSDYNRISEKIDLDEFYERSSEKYNPNVVTGYLTITEGRKHQVKRMLKSVGCYIIYLKRVSIGNLKLDETLESGEYRKLTNAEIKYALER